MINNGDKMTILEKLKPVTTIDDHWPAPARDAALEQLLTVAADNPPQSRRHPRKRRILVTAALAAVLVSSSAGIAAAGGLLPESFTKPLSFWTTETGGAVDVQTARRVAQGPGPDGKVLSVWSAKNQDGTTCIAPMFEPPGDLDRPAPKDFKLAGGQCTPADLHTQSFGDGGGSMDGQGIHTMWAAAGNATRAELRLPDGTERPAVQAEGLFFFWYLANEAVNPPALVGYDATGKVVAEHALPNLSAPEKTRTGG
jgi:hypothetical protein